MTPLYVVLGGLFGFVLSRSGAADYNMIEQMFLLQRFDLYGVLGIAVVIAAAGLWVMKRRGRVLGGSPLTIEVKAMHRGNVLGGVLFGIGWSMTGMCPGPMFVNLGEGKLYALAALAGALTGAGAFGALYARLQGLLALPPLVTGTGEG